MGDPDNAPVADEDLERAVGNLSLEEADQSIQDFLERIEQNAGVKGGKLTVIRALSSLNPFVHHFGLSPDQVVQALDVVLSGKLDDTTNRKLVKLLLPRQHVPEVCAVKVLGSLGRQLSLPIQAAALRWVILVYDIFDSRTKLQQLYGVAFHYLTYETLRPSSSAQTKIQQPLLPHFRTDGVTSLMQSHMDCYSMDPKTRLCAVGQSDKNSLTPIFRMHSQYIERVKAYWLGQELMDLWYWSEKTEATRTKFAAILSKVVDVTVMIKDLLPVMEYFLMPYLRVWNGVDYQKEIFTLLTYLRPRAYEELYVHFLKPLYGLFYIMGPIWKGELILCYSRLLQRWAQFKWRDYLELGKNPRLPRQGLEGLRRLFTKLAPNVDYMQTIRAFIGHVDNISSVALEMEGDHLAVQHGVLSFFDLTSTLTGTYRLPLAVVIPDSTIVYRCFLSSSGMSVSRICGIVYQFKQAFEAFEQDQQLQYELLVQSQLSHREGAAGDIDDPEKLAAMPAPQEIPGYSREYVVLFNSFVMDICNFLWRNRAFNKSDKNARGFLMDQQAIGHTRQVCVDGGLSMNNMHSITHSLALSGFSARFLRSLEERNGIPVEKRLKAPASTPALKDMVSKGGLNMTFDEYRIQYLDHLEAKGFEGVSQFLFDCITNLLQRKLQSQERQRELHEQEMRQP
ncbi:hypothetical protein BGZ72_003846 [Mortierella alpina]|nr:hypothetical protein BGZ72_003846 [Mortierella alpina]